MKQITARIESRVDLIGRLEVAGSNDHMVLLSGRGAVGVVRPDGFTRVWASGARQVLSASLSANGRIAILETHAKPNARWPTFVRFVDPETDAESSLDANVTGALAFDYGTGGAVAWGGASSLWLAGVDDASEELWVGQIDAQTSELRGGTGFPDPYGESAVRFSAARPDACVLNLDAGQHGGWMYVARIGPNDTVDVAQHAPTSEVMDQVEQDGHLLVLERCSLVKRRASDVEVVSELGLPEIGLPLQLVGGAAGLLLVFYDLGEALIIDTRAMEVLGGLAIPGLGGQDGLLATTLMPSGISATSRSTGPFGKERTQVAFWTLPEGLQNRDYSPSRPTTHDHLEAPWERIDIPNELHEELAREMSPGHPLRGIGAKAVAHRCDCDDVLFELSGAPFGLAVVHLTWSKETDPRWPHTELYRDWDHFVKEHLEPDAREWDALNEEEPEAT